MREFPTPPEQSKVVQWKFGKNLKIFSGSAKFRFLVNFSRFPEAGRAARFARRRPPPAPPLAGRKKIAGLPLYPTPVPCGVRASTEPGPGRGRRGPGGPPPARRPEVPWTDDAGAPRGRGAIFLCFLFFVSHSPP